MRKLSFLVFVVLIGLIMWGGGYALKVYKITKATPIESYQGVVSK